MQFYVLLLIIYLNGEPTIRTEVFPDWASCSAARIEWEQKPSVGNATCAGISE